MIHEIKTVKHLTNILEGLECSGRLVGTLRIENCHSLGCVIGSDEEGDLVIVSQYQQYTPKVYDDIIVIGSDATVGQLIELLAQVPGHTRIKNIRIKGSSNMIYMEVTKEGLIAHD